MGYLGGLRSSSVSVLGTPTVGTWKHVPLRRAQISLLMCTLVCAYNCHSCRWYPALEFIWRRGTGTTALNELRARSERRAETTHVIFNSGRVRSCVCIWLSSSPSPFILGLRLGGSWRPLGLRRRSRFRPHTPPSLPATGGLFWGPLHLTLLGRGHLLVSLSEMMAGF